MIEKKLLLEKAVYSGLDFFFIVPCDQPRTAPQISHWQMTRLRKLHSMWRAILDIQAGEKGSTGKFWRRINYFGRPASGRKFNSLIYSFRGDHSKKKYFVLVPDGDNYPWFEINSLINQEQIKQGCLPVHACGIVRGDANYIFGGPSGIGKSTISSLSIALGCEVIDEDQLLLKFPAEGVVTADAWGYSLNKCDLPVKALFKLVQATENRMLRMSRSQTTMFLLQQVLQTSGNITSPVQMQKIIKFVTAVCRHIPGYELQFDKSTEFWRVIDESLFAGN